MKKKVILLTILALMFILPLTTAQLNGTIQNNAYDCIQDKVQEKGCSTFGLEDKIFSVLSTGQCRSELLGEAQNNECWGLNDCTLKETSQAILALLEAGSNTDDYVNWILANNRTAQGIDWLIQLESAGATSCELKDLDNNNYQVSIDENKKLTLTNTQNCLTLDSSRYWLKIKPSCYDQEFEISCDESFLTSPLFKKTTSSLLYVLDELPQTASADGTTFTEKIDSLCFKKGTFCDYEGTLWATLVLKKLNQDISPYLPYLIAFEDDNEDLLPESFLYYLTGNQDYISEIILKQKGNKYWDEAGDRYYDTALALLPFSGESIEAKDNAINWLTDVQGGDGCWDSGNVARTGFLLYSLWPRAFTGNGEPSDDCEASGFFCISDIECTDAGGSELGAYSGCSSFNEVCCSEDKLAQTCADLEGEICDLATQDCSGGYEDDAAADLAYSETCCVLGICQDKITTSEDSCTPAGGICKDFGCESGEEEDIYNYCSDTSQYCCVAKEKGGSLWWIWVLIILIVLTALAIVYRDKLKEFYIKLKAKKFSPPKGPRRPGIPTMGIPQGRPMPPRRILPIQQHAPMRRPPIQARGKTKELDEVLKKLKEMGK